MILPFVSSLLFAAAAPSQPVDVRGVLVELTIDAEGVTRACGTVESAGSKTIDVMACLLVAGHGIALPEGMPERRDD